MNRLGYTLLERGRNADAIRICDLNFRQFPNSSNPFGPEGGMSEPTIVDYLSAVGGVVGAVTGIPGAIWGYLGYRASKKVKALDLRLELRKQVGDLRRDLAELPSLLHRAFQSYHEVLNARGIQDSSDQALQWRIHCHYDIDDAETKLPARLRSDEDYASLNGHDQLEDALVEVATVRDQARRLREKYMASLDDDRRCVERMGSPH